MSRDDRPTAGAPHEDGGADDRPSPAGADGEVGADEPREGLPPQANPMKTFVIGLAAVAAALLAIFMIYQYVLAPETDATTQPGRDPGQRILRPIGPQFVDVTQEARLMVSTRQGDAIGVKRYISEAKGGGIAFLDYDNDGWLDIYIVNAGPLTPRPDEVPAHNYLMRNRRNGAFEDVTEKAGVGDTGYGIGVCAGDFDNDGHIDVYVTNVGRNVLYRNRGDGTFENVTEQAGVAGDAYSVGATFLDYDLDGHLDLFVGNYVALDREVVQPLSGRWKGGHVYFGPRGLKGVPDVLYRNNGDQTFRDVSSDSGIASVARRSLGVVAGDADGDGRPDILVACDREPNTYYHNQGEGGFKEMGLESGLAYGRGGTARGSIGIDLGDLDNDLRPDVVVGTFSAEPLSVLRGEPAEMWLSASGRFGMRGSLIPFATFGVSIVDYDGDGDRDIITANGHVYPDIRHFDQMTGYGQPAVILRNEGRRWQPVIRQAGPGIAQALPSRGLAVGDYDNDGDLDLLVANIDRPPALLRNDGPSGGRVLVVQLEGTTSNRSAIGARVTVRTGTQRQVVEIKGGSGFASQSDLRAYIGLGSAAAADELTIRWPTGKTVAHANIPADSLVTAIEGNDVTWKALERPAAATRPAAPSL